jgi:hypothetical protein
MKEKVLTIFRIPSSYQMCFLILSHNEKNKVERELKEIELYYAGTNMFRASNVQGIVAKKNHITSFHKKVYRNSHTIFLIYPLCILTLYIPF